MRDEGNKQEGVAGQDDHGETRAESLPDENKRSKGRTRGEIASHGSRSGRSEEGREGVLGLRGIDEAARSNEEAE